MDSLQEVLPKAGLVYSEKGNLNQVLSKPKILALKSVSLLQLQEMEMKAKNLDKHMDVSDGVIDGGKAIFSNETMVREKDLQGPASTNVVSYPVLFSVCRWKGLTQCFSFLAISLDDVWVIHINNFFNLFLQTFNNSKRVRDLLFLRSITYVRICEILLQELVELKPFMQKLVVEKEWR